MEKRIFGRMSERATERKPERPSGRPCGRKSGRSAEGFRHWLKAGAALFMSFIMLFLSACGAATEFKTHTEQKAEGEADAVFGAGFGRETLRIVSGSENRVLEPILKKFAEKEKICLEMTYSGSLGIMRLLGDEVMHYDAVWPASSLWISVGDEKHRVKHLESTSTTPVIFGIRKSKAEELGFVGRDVHVRDILQAIKEKKLSFTMTSASQSNSGAGAYIGFIYALLDSPPQITSEALHDKQFQEDMRTLLSGVERSSGSSDWLKELFVSSDFDAMVNYEALIISANQELERQGKETLYAVYPVDGMTMANSPLGFVSENGEEGRNQEKSEEAFLKLQDYLLSEKVQDEIQKTGRRTGMGGVSEKNKKVFRSDWGIDTERVIGTINMPQRDVLFEALDLYQRTFKKPGLNVFVLDYSGSMLGDGQEQLLAALRQIMFDEEASHYFLQASDHEKNIFLPFSTDTYPAETAEGSEELKDIYKDLELIPASGGTALYEALCEALKYVSAEDTEYYSPAIIVMTDGKANGPVKLDTFIQAREKAGLSVPVFSILFGQSSDAEMERLSEATGGRVFDGRDDLNAAFRAVRGYN